MARFQGVEPVPLPCVIWVDSYNFHIFNETPPSFCLFSNIFLYSLLKLNLGRGAFFQQFWGPPTQAFAAQIGSSDKTRCDLSVANCGGYFPLIYMRAPDQWRTIGRKSTYTLGFSQSLNICFGLVKFLSMFQSALVGPLLLKLCRRCTAGSSVQL